MPNKECAATLRFRDSHVGCLHWHTASKIAVKLCPHNKWRNPKWKRPPRQGTRAARVDSRPTGKKIDSTTKYHSAARRTWPNKDKSAPYYQNSTSNNQNSSQLRDSTPQARKLTPSSNVFLRNKRNKTLVMNNSTPKARIRPSTWETRSAHNILASLHNKLISTNKSTSTKKTQLSKMKYSTTLKHNKEIWMISHLWSARWIVSEPNLC